MSLPARLVVLRLALGIGCVQAATSAAPQAAPASLTTLVVETDPPGARITVDGLSVGLSPATLTTLTPGAHSVAAAMPGHLPGTQVALVRPGRVTRVVLKLAPAGPTAVAPPSSAPPPSAPPRAPEAIAVATRTLGPACSAWYTLDGLSRSPEALLRRFDCPALRANANTPASTLAHCDSTLRAMESSLAKRDAAAAWRAALQAGATGTPDTAAAGREWARLAAEVSSGKKLDPVAVSTRGYLVQAPALATADARVQEALCAAASAWSEELPGAATARQEKLARGLLWIERVLWADDTVPTPQAWTKAFEGTGSGHFALEVEPFSGLAQASRPALNPLVEIGRKRAVEFWRVAVETAARKKQAGPTLAALAAGSALANSDDERWTATLQSIEDELRGWRDAAMAALQGATDAASLNTAYVSVTAIDRATGGALSVQTPAEAAQVQSSVEALFERDPGKHLERLPKLPQRNTDAGTVVHGVLRDRVVNWGIDALRQPGADPELPSRLLAATENDPRLTALLGDLAREKRAAQTAAFERIFQAGRVASALHLARSSTTLSADDRGFLERTWASAISDTVKHARLEVVPMPLDPRARQLVEAAGLSMPPSETALWLEVRTERFEVAGRKPLRTESGRSRYLAGTQMGPNPEIPTCQAEEVEAQNAAMEAKATYDRLQLAYKQCMEGASRLQNKGGWAGALGAVGGVACVAVDASIAADVSTTANRARQVSQRCGGLPVMVSVERWENHAYPIRIYGTQGTATIGLRLLDPEATTADAGVLWSARIESTTSTEDREVEAEPRYNVAADPLALPSADEAVATLQRELVAALTKQIWEARKSAWRAHERRASNAADPADRWEHAATLSLLVADGTAPPEAARVVLSAEREMQALLTEVPARPAREARPYALAVVHADPAVIQDGDRVRRVEPPAPPAPQVPEAPAAAPAPAQSTPVAAAAVSAPTPAPGGGGCGALKFALACTDKASKAAGECEGVVKATPSTHCEAHCKTAGLLCVDAWDDQGNTCGHGGSIACDRKMGSFVCRCGPP